MSQWLGFCVFIKKNCYLGQLGHVQVFLFYGNLGNVFNVTNKILHWYSVSTSLSVGTIAFSEHGFRTPPPQQKSSQQTPESSLIFSTSQGSFSGGEGSPHSMMWPFSPGLASPASASPAHFHTVYSPSMSPFSSSFGYSLDRVSVLYTEMYVYFL